MVLNLKKNCEEKELLTVWIYSRIANRLKEIAEAENVKHTDLMRHIINEFLDNYEKKEKFMKSSDTQKLIDGGV